MEFDYDYHNSAGYRLGEQEMRNRTHLRNMDKTIERIEREMQEEWARMTPAQRAAEQADIDRRWNEIKKRFGID